MYYYNIVEFNNKESNIYQVYITSKKYELYCLIEEALEE